MFKSGLDHIDQMLKVSQCLYSRILELYSSSLSAFSVRQTILLLYFRTAPVWRYLPIPAQGKGSWWFWNHTSCLPRVRCWGYWAGGLWSKWGEANHSFNKVYLLISYLSQDMTPLLNPCFYYISSRGLDRIFTILGHLFGGSIQILNEVKLT